MMKKIIVSFAALVLTTGIFAQKKADEVAKFAAETIDLGKVKQNVPATATFTVTNIGNEPLIIEQASPSCGCTIGNYTKEPIAPGKTGSITATFNAAALNHFTKSLTVKFAGVDEVKTIVISGDVLAAEEFDKGKTEAPGATITKAQTVTQAAKPAVVAKPKPAAKIVQTKKAVKPAVKS
jgi:Protein of unknown function (DUF1573)